MDIASGSVPTNVPDDDLWYDMDHQSRGGRRGKCAIFNFSKVESEEDRKGTEKDVEMIREALGKNTLGFTVELYENNKCTAMKEALLKLANEDHTHSDCFVCFVLTHGKKGVIICTDGKKMPLQHIYDPFLKSKTLAGKPKLFFIQACRGTHVDKGIRVCHADSLCSTMPPDVTITLPTCSDMWIYYSTTEGYVSSRSPQRGSLFIETLCEVLRTHNQRMDFLAMMTLVNNYVARAECDLLTHGEVHRNVKQMPTFHSSLRKNLRFAPQVRSEVTAPAHGARLLEDVTPQSRTSSHDVTAPAHGARLLEDITPQSRTSSHDDMAPCWAVSPGQAILNSAAKAVYSWLASLKHRPALRTNVSEPGRR